MTPTASGTPTATPTSTPTPTPGDPCGNINPAGTYLDAENYSADINQGATYYFAGIESSTAGFVGYGYLQTGTTQNQLDYSDANANPGNYERYDYTVDFPTPGTYNLWIRGYAPVAGSDSIFVGIDGVAVGALTESPSVGAWVWTNTIENGVNTVTVTTTGLHTISVWPRAQNHELDGLFLTTTSTVPSGGIPSGATVIDPSTCIESCPAGTPTQAPTPAFTPNSGCSATPASGDLAASIVHASNPTTCTFTNNSTTCSYAIGLASYKMYDSNINDQELYDYHLTVIAPNTTLTLTVNNPPCASQADAFYGSILYSLAGDVRYGSRLLTSAQTNASEDDPGYCTLYCQPTPSPTPT